MPIAKELNFYYGRTWREYRASLIRAHGSRCSACKRDVPAYLNLAHLNHDQKTSEIALLCMACHNRHDARYRLAIWRRRKAERDGQLWLMPEIEWAPLPRWRVPDRVIQQMVYAANRRLF